MRRIALSAAAFACAALLNGAPARAQQLDTPDLTVENSGLTSIRVLVTAGPSGAPAGELPQSNPSPILASQTLAQSGCTFTQGYWKNHASAWSLGALTISGVTYTQSQLLSIFNAPAKGNGLLTLMHQLIAAKLNIA